MKNIFRNIFKKTTDMVTTSIKYEWEVRIAIHEMNGAESIWVEMPSQYYATEDEARKAIEVYVAGIPGEWRSRDGLACQYVFTGDNHMKRQYLFAIHYRWYVDNQ